MHLRHLAPVFAAAAMIAGCGYHMGGGISSYPQIRTVAVPVFINSTFEPALEMPVTSALKNAIIRDGHWRVVDLPEGADATIVSIGPRFHSRCRGW
jgi:hypothetical protein